MSVKQGHAGFDTLSIHLDTNSNYNNSFETGEVAGSIPVSPILGGVAQLVER